MYPCIYWVVRSFRLKREAGRPIAIESLRENCGQHQDAHRDISENPGWTSLKPLYTVESNEPVERQSSRSSMMMGIMEQRYQNGLEIRVADVVSYNGQRGTIVFVADRQEYSEGYPQSDWPLSEHPAGFMIEFTNGARLFLESSDDYGATSRLKPHVRWIVSPE